MENGHMLRPTLQGKIAFSCCGNIFTQETDFSQCFICPICRTSYELFLVARRHEMVKYPRGTNLRLKQDVMTRVGSEEKQLKAGSIYTAGADVFRVLGTNEDMTALEIPMPTDSHPNSRLLAFVKNEILEEIPLNVRDGTFNVEPK